MENKLLNQNIFIGSKTRKFSALSFNNSGVSQVQFVDNNYYLSQLLVYPQTPKTNNWNHHHSSSEEFRTDMLMLRTTS